MKNTSPWIAHWKSRAGAYLRLFCFPYAGAGPSVFRDWVRDLPTTIDILPVQFPGRESRSTEAPHSRISDLVTAVVDGLLPYADRPFAFFGHSMGALVAFETARALIQKGYRAPDHLIVSARRAPRMLSCKPLTHTLPDEQFIEQLQSYLGTPREVLQSNDLLNFYLPILRADFAACESYVYLPGRRLEIPVTVYGAQEDPDVSYPDLQGWAEETTRPCRIRMFPGGHFFLRQHRAALLESLKEDLSRHVRVGYI